MKSVGELSKVYSQIVLKCWYLVWKGETRWGARRSQAILHIFSEQTCTIDHEMDQSMWQTPESIDFIYSSYSEYKKYCYVGNTAKQCRLGLFQDSDFERDLEDSESTSGGICVFGSHTFVPISWMCKKQTSVSHSSTESAIIFGAGITALDLCEVILLVFGIQIRSMIERWDPLIAVIRITCATNLEEWSMCWIMLILFLQTSNLFIRKLGCMCLKTTKQWSRRL